VKRRMLGIAIIALGLSLAAGESVRAADLGYTFKSVAALDTTVAGEPIHGDFEIGAVNAAGAVGFVTELDNGEGALYIGPDGTAEVLKKTDADVPTGGKFTGYISNKVGVNDAGDVLISAGVDTGNGEIITPLLFERATKKWTSIASQGMPAPDGGDFNGGNSFASFNNTDDVAFCEQVTDSTAGPAGSAVFLWSKGKVTTVVRPGMKIDRGTFVDSWRPQISNSGIVTFEGKIGDDADYSAYMWKDGKITELASVETAVPGGSGKFSALRGVTANSNGDVAMLGNTDAGWGVYLYTAKDQKLIKVAAPGDAAPGGGTLGDAFNSYRNSVRIGEDGSVLFEANLDSGSGVFLWKDGNLGVVERTGQDLKGVGTAADIPGSGLGLASNGVLLLVVNTADGKTQAVVGTPPQAPAAPGP
jgi:hypothetical protein